MTFRKSRTFTEGELEFMKVLWSLGEATPDEVQSALQDQGRSLTHGTIRNVLVVMIEKGYVTRTKKGKAYLYKAKVSEVQAKKSMLQDLIDRAFNGSESHMIATLLNGKEIRTNERKKIRRLIDEVKKEKE